MYNDILKNPKFKKEMASIQEAEKDREFCHHSIDHSLDVARIAYIISLENGLGISKDIIYATALLHDIGRSMGKEDHNINSANMAEEIMEECGYDSESIEAAAYAILHHRDKSGTTASLRDIISIADKECRRCYCCRAYDRCIWKDEDKNKDIPR